MKELKHLFYTVGLLTGVVLLLAGCGNHDYTPKPKAYPRIVFPERKYELYDPADCPFRFEKPVYTQVVYDTMYQGHKIDERCWMNLVFPPFNGTVNLTYKDIDDTTNIARLIEDAHTLSYKHTKKADYIDEIRIANNHGVGGLLYEVSGDAASNIQFFLTDSSKHFIRGAVYFYNPPNSDSMAPVIAFVKEDLHQMLKTFEWK